MISLPHTFLHGVKSVTKVTKAGYNIAKRKVSGQNHFTAGKDLLLLVKALHTLLARIQGGIICDLLT